MRTARMAIFYGFLIIMALLFLSANACYANSLELNLKVTNISYAPKDTGALTLDTELKRRTRNIKVPSDEIAIIVVDSWDIRRERHISDYGAHKVLSKTVAPLLRTARKADMVIIHAAHRPVRWDGTNKRPNMDLRSPWAGESKFVPNSVKMRMKDSNVWPPLEFIFRVGKAGQVALNSFPDYLAYPKVIGLHKEVKPQRRTKEYIESSKAEVINILRTHRVKYLLYAGGAADQCILGRPVGIRSMSSIGYCTMLIKDAVYATLFYDVHGVKHSMLPSAINEVETQHGFTVNAQNIINEINQISNSN